MRLWTCFGTVLDILKLFEVGNGWFILKWSPISVSISQ
jgi:hypothetical protein